MSIQEPNTLMSIKIINNIIGDDNVKNMMKKATAMALIASVTISSAVFGAVYVTNCNSVKNNAIDYYVISNYSSSVTSGISTWNKVGNVSLRTVSSPPSNYNTYSRGFVYVTDMPLNNAYLAAYGYGVTPCDAILLNSNLFPNMSSSERLSTVAHEIGHSLGLDENFNNSSNLMWWSNGTRTTLGNDDRDSYNFLWGSNVKGGTNSYVSPNTGTKNDIQFVVSDSYDASSEEEMMGAHHNVFIGIVREKLSPLDEHDRYKVKMDDKLVFEIPVTNYLVTPIYNIKGELIIGEDIIVEENYLEKADGSTVSMLSREKMEVGNTYLIHARNTGEDKTKYHNANNQLVLVSGLAEGTVQPLILTGQINRQRLTSSEVKEDFELLSKENFTETIEKYEEIYENEVMYRYD